MMGGKGSVRGELVEPRALSAALRQAQDERKQESGLRSIRFAGYAALFGIPDGAGDVIRKGAFARDLARDLAKGTPLPLLWQHDTARRIGSAEMLAEDRRGLRVIGRIEQPASRAAAELLRRTVTGLSFGYRAREYRRLPGLGTGGGRLLEDIELIEISLVTHPLQFGARVHFVT